MVLADEILDLLMDTYAPAKAESESWDLGQVREEVVRIFDVDADLLRDLDPSR